MINILADNNFVLDAFNPASIALGIAKRMRERRLEMNLTQQRYGGINLSSCPK